MEATRDISVEVTVKSPLGLHGRPAAQIVKMVSAHHCQVTLTNLSSGESGDCGSILSLLVLAASQGTHMLIHAVGDDASAAAAEISDYFSDGFNE